MATMIRSKLFLLFTIASSASALILPDGVGRLPALGWNSWNAYHCDVSEEKILVAANLTVSLGLKDAGYQYINIDDCWSNKSGRDSVTKQIIPNSTTFPGGISGTASKVHSMGLKMGIYSSAGTETCAGYPASLGYESIDASTFAAWGIDYLKYDNCNIPTNWTDQYSWCIEDRSSDVGRNGTCLDVSNPAPHGYNWSTSLSADRWGTADVESWGNTTGSSWRMSNDIEPDWAHFMIILNENSFIMDYDNFWGHNDADMLEVGNGNLTYSEQRSHFALWAIMKSPLIIGTDLSKLSSELVNLLKNPYLLAFNQDQTVGSPAAPYKWGINPKWTWNSSFPAEYWAGPSSNGTIIAMLNTLNNTEQKTANFSEIPGLDANSSYSLINVWTGNSLGCFSGNYTVSVETHDTAVLLVQPCTNGSISPSSNTTSNSTAAVSSATVTATPTGSSSTPTSGAAALSISFAPTVSILTVIVFSLVGADLL